MARLPRPTPVNQEVVFDGGVMITETDTRGVITYVNRKWSEMTGYTKEEAIGQPHNINRHPDMPQAAFAEIWETIQRGEMWEGYVKNLRKDGKFYWVIVWIKPKHDESGNVVGYIAGRKVPDRMLVNKFALEYAKMRDKEK